jgi:hypothetical protein
MKRRRISGLLNLENIAPTTIVLFVIIVLSIPLIIGFTGVYADPGIQNVDIQVKVRMKNGGLAAYPRIQIYHLAEQGPRLLASGSGSQNGLYSWRITIPRIWKNRLNVSELMREIDLYEAANILILAYDDKTNTAGSLVVSVDPSFMKWPFESFLTGVNLTDELPRSIGTLSLGVLSMPPPSETWKNTVVVEFAVWDQIWASAYFPIGSKIDVQTKQRVYDPSNNRYLTGWASPGSTTITLDVGRGTQEITGKLKYSHIFQFKYILCYVSIPNTPYYYEIVYATDTSSDPIYSDCGSLASWSGSASGANPYITGQNQSLDIPLTQTSQWCFTISVGFSVSFPTGTMSISVSLGVSKSSLPYAVLHIRTGTWTTGYRVFTYGSEYGFRKSYSIWKYTTP